MRVECSKVELAGHGSLRPKAASKSCSDCIVFVASIVSVTVGDTMTKPTQFSKEAL